MMCFTIESPSTSVSASTHWSPSYVLDVELMQWRLSGFPLKSIAVPGEHMLPVVRGRPLLNPPRYWFSTEIGKFWSRGIVRGSCE